LLSNKLAEPLLIKRRPAYNFTGSHATIYNAFVDYAKEFDVTPTQVSAVA
jgi:hypothetical protein